MLKGKKGMGICAILFTGFFVLALTCVLALPPTASAAPAQVIKWKMITPYPAGSMEHEITGVLFSKMVKEMSGGRLEITPYPDGALTGSFEVLDSLKSNLVQLTTVWSFYFMRKDPGLSLSIGVPYGVTPRECQAYLDKYGGIELMQEIMGKLGAVYVDATSPAIAGDNCQSVKKLKSIADVKGLKSREIGPAAETQVKLGLSVVSLPPGEIYTALQHGTIDFVSYASINMNYRYRFHEVAKYLYLPGWNDSWIHEILANPAQWKKLPDDLKAIVKAAFRSVHLGPFQSASVMEEHKILKELAQKGEVLHWSKEDLRIVRAADLETYQDYAKGKGGETGKKIASHKLKFCDEIGLSKR